MADPQVVREYVDDLRGLLEKSSIIEQRSFLKSFVDRIEVCDLELNMYYTIPIPPSSLVHETIGVIPFAHHGWPRGTKGKTFVHTFALNQGNIQKPTLDTKQTPPHRRL
jgi:hypothetical protein